MPNWCENRLSVSGPKSVIAVIVQAIGLDRGEFDFNGIVPMPDDLHITKGSATSWGEDVLYGDWKRVIEYPGFVKGSFLPSDQSRSIGRKWYL